MMDEPLLLQFPGPLTLYPSRSKYILFFAASLCFVALGLSVLVKVDNSATSWFCLWFFAACAVVFGIYLLPGSVSLTLDADGFQIRHFYFVRTALWQNVTNLDVYCVPFSPTKLVVYIDTQLNGWRHGRWVITSMGFNAILPDTYGMSADDLAALMAQWRARVLGPLQLSELVRC